MKDIDKCAREYADKTVQQCINVTMDELKGYAIADFKAGVEFAQEWISVKITPEWYTGCRLDILVKNETFKYPASVKIHTIYSDKDIQELKAMFTHWRPIELK